jgi:hypothetical protein
VCHPVPLPSSPSAASRSAIPAKRRCVAVLTGRQFSPVATRFFPSAAVSLGALVSSFQMLHRPASCLGGVLRLTCWPRRDWFPRARHLGCFDAALSEEQSPARPLSAASPPLHPVRQHAVVHGAEPAGA